MATLTGLHAKIAAAKRESFREAKDGHAFVWGRGQWIATVGHDGNQCLPSPGADATQWHGRIAQVRAFIADIEANHPQVARIVIEGGYDGGDTMADREMNYEPWVSSWTVEVWRRNQTEASR